MKNRSYRLLSFVVVVSAATAHAQPLEYKDRLGVLNDPDLISPEGLEASRAVAVTTSGYVMGISAQFASEDAPGFVAWGGDVNGGAVHRLGLYDAEHTSPQGGNISIPLWMNTAGVVVGISAKSDGISMAPSDMDFWVSDLSVGITHKLGLVGTEYEDDEGNTSTFVDVISRNGIIAGSSLRGGGSDGIAVWLANSTGNNVRIGFFDAQHTQLTGEQFSAVGGVSDEGLAAGTSYRVNAEGSFSGSTAWVADISGGTRQVGYTDGAYVDAEGNISSQAVGFASGNLVAGTSDFYTGSDFLGTAAWVTDLDTDAITRIGLFDAQHTGSSGEQESWVSHIPYNDDRRGSIGSFFSDEVAMIDEPQPDPGTTAYIGGGSLNYTSVSEDNESAWVWSSSSGDTTRLGLIGGKFTDSNGGEHSELRHLKATGFAAGISEIYDGSSVNGQAVWVADVTAGSGSVRAGLTGGKFTSLSGREYSEVSGITRSGYAAGVSQIYSDDDSNIGKSAWAANASTGETFEVGITGPEFVLSNGAQESRVIRITESGVIAGYSDISAGNHWNGTAAWAATMENPEAVRLGLNSEAFTAPDGNQYSEITHLTESGYVGGFSDRYDSGGTIFGSTAWVYNAFTGVQTNFDLYLDAASGFSDSVLNGVTENGIAYGSFFSGDFNSSTNLLDDYKAFIWSSELGMLVLNDEIGEQIALQGWSSLSSADAVLPNGYVIGWGTLSSGGQGVYLAQIPEASSLLLAFTGLPLMFRRRRVA